MKIGILTFHRAYNYGAFLQSFALQEYLKSLGHEVSVIDYEPFYFREDYAVIPPLNAEGLSLFGLFRRIVGRAVRILPNLTRKKGFEKEINRSLNLTKKRTADFSDVDLSGFDALFFGSDQIWTARITRGFDPVYWGEFDFDGLKIAYAASAGDDFSDLEKIDIGSKLKKFDSISVREKKLEEYLDEKGISACTVLDPTLMMNSRFWLDYCSQRTRKEKTGYVLLYIIKLSNEARNIAKKIGKEKDLPVKEIFYRKVGVNPKSWYNISPVEFVRLFRDAEYIVTTSFHGTCFACQFQKDFYYVNNGTNDYRIESLLKNANIQGRIISSEADVDLMKKIEWNSSDLMSEVKQQSVAFIDKALSIKENLSDT